MKWPQTIIDAIVAHLFDTNTYITQSAWRDLDKRVNEEIKRRNQSGMRWTRRRRPCVRRQSVTEHAGFSRRADEKGGIREILS